LYTFCLVRRRRKAKEYSFVVQNLHKFAIYFPFSENHNEIKQQKLFFTEESFEWR
jgi:hypothetical protein